MSVYVGIDGGGSRTTAVVTDAAGAELGRVAGERGRIDPLDPAAGTPVLVELTRRALERAGHEAPAQALCCALSGAGRLADRALLEQALARAAVATTAIVVPDAEAALQDAFGDGPGILVICGTGSIAWGRDQRGAVARAGGWGQLIGDEGSGYAIGLAALRAALRAHDGRTGETALLSLVLERSGVTDPEQLVAWSAQAGVGGIAALAPAVVEAAAHDPTAAGIAADAARELASHVAAVYARLEPWPTTATVAFTGGLIAPGGTLRSRVEGALGEWELDLALLERAIDAALGAAALARFAVAQ